MIGLKVFEKSSKNGFSAIIDYRKTIFRSKLILKAYKADAGRHTERYF